MDSISLNEHTERGKTPIPKGAYKFVNPIIKFVLRSPLHRALSHAMMILSFRGRRSGKIISVPVGYTRKGNLLVVFTFGNWWKNLQNNANVSMRLQGKDVAGRANIVTDLNTVAEMVNGVFKARGEEMAKRMGFEPIPEDASPEEIKKKSQNLVFIQIDMGGANG